MKNNPEFQEILSKLRAAETNGWSNMSEPTQTQLASSLSEFLFRSLGENKMHQPLGILILSINKYHFYPISIKQHLQMMTKRKKNSITSE